MTTCARSFFFSFGLHSFPLLCLFFPSFSGSELGSKCFFVSLALWYMSVSQQEWPTCQSTPTITTIPAPSHLHSGWIREWSVRGHGLIVQPKNSPRLSPLWAFHLGSFIGPVQHFLSCVARVLGCVGMALILTWTQKHENRTEGGHCTWRRVGKVAEKVCERWYRMSYAKCNLRKWVKLKQKSEYRRGIFVGTKITFFLN